VVCIGSKNSEKKRRFFGFIECMFAVQATIAAQSLHHRAPAAAEKAGIFVRAIERSAAAVTLPGNLKIL
jgi:hypothetical protein